jgi:hypothetical protein
MRRHAVSCLLFVIISSGCARLEIPAEGIFPLRAEFEGAAIVQGKITPLSGAVVLASAESGMAQLYGPGGLAAYILDTQHGVLQVKDAWGRPIRSYTIPVKDCIGALAGIPPRGLYLCKKLEEDRVKVVYLWGVMILDSRMQPRQMHIGGDMPLDVTFVPEAKGISLMVQQGSDKLTLTITIREGGRWMHDDNHL